MSNIPPVAMQVTRHFNAPAEKVFDAWLDPAIARKWLFATPGGEMVRAEIDPKVGGKFTFTDRRGGEDIEHTGMYEVIAHPEHLVFSFTVPKYSDAPSRIDVAFVPEGEGCKLILTQAEHPADTVERSKAGWGKVLDALAASLQ